MSQLDTFGLDFALGFNRGRRRETNEDAVGYFYPQNFDQFASHGGMFLVADGVGGLAEGGQASDMAIHLMIEQYRQSDPRESVESRLVTTIHEVNAQIYNRFQESATTLLAMIIKGRIATIANVGDCRAYITTNGRLQQITIDNVTRVQTPSGKMKNKLTRAIGHKATVEVDKYEVVLEPGLSLVMVSDGVTRYLGAAQLHNFLKSRSTTESVRAIVDASNDAGGIDNISAVVINIMQPIQSSRDFAAYQNWFDQSEVFVNIPDYGEDVPKAPTRQPVAPATRALVTTRGRSLWPAIAAIVIIATVVFFMMQPPAVNVTNGTSDTTNVPVVDTVDDNQNTDDPSSSSDNNEITSSPSSTNDPNADSQIQGITPSAIERVISHEEFPDILQSGMGVYFTASAITYVQIKRDVAAFTIDPSHRYRVQTIFPSEGKNWYRLYDIENEQQGWIDGENLPNYTID